ncbi:MAG: dihydroorotase, partial [Sphingobacteriaceae bacterium]
HQQKLTIEQVAEKMAHNPAVCFGVEKRGFIREGFWADLVTVDLNLPWTVSKENILYKCGWSPFEGQTFQSSVTHTLVSGNLVWADGKISTDKIGQRLVFKR